MLFAVALIVGACGSKKATNTSAPPSLPGLSTPSTTAAGPTTSIKATEECRLLAAFRQAEYGVGVAPKDQQQKYVDGAVAYAEQIRAKVPTISADVDALLAAVKSLAQTGATTPEEKSSVEKANANLAKWWDSTCVVT
ncbi:MAG: hypothetical protein N2037_02585 [Acidimicrobiales bacterium]|nr:hypothetical protein [Acidimicrobiales bacterium]